MNTSRSFRAALVLGVLSLLLVSAQAGSATWNLNPTNGSWDTTTNWTPVTVPNGPSDIASFGVSNQTSVSLPSSIQVSEIIFNPGASSFSITPGPTQDRVLTISGAGITNNSGVSQNFPLTFSPATSGEVHFVNSATAGSGTVYTNHGGSSANGGGRTAFYDTATAGAAAFVNGGANSGNDPSTDFYNSSTAGIATISNNSAATGAGARGLTEFHDTASADHAFIYNFGNLSSSATTGLTQFLGNSTAGFATVTAYGGPTYGLTYFGDNATAGSATIIAESAPVPGVFGGRVNFAAASTAGNATITSKGGTMTGAGGGYTIFAFGGNGGEATFIAEGGAVPGSGGGTVDVNTDGDAGNATLIAYGGADAGAYGAILFSSTSTGGTARVELFGGQLDLRAHVPLSIVNIGSLEGDGEVFLQGNTLVVGATNLSTTFAGIIHAEGDGMLQKTGKGTFTLTGANDIARGIVVEDGQLLVNNRHGSGTGHGFVQVNAGTLGGGGQIMGLVTIGDGRTRKAILSPGPGTGKFRSLTMASRLTFKSDGTYRFELNSARGTGDKVIANGVTIEDGAQFLTSETRSGVLAAGTVLTAIDNTGPSAITGTFSNLADGSALTIGSNTYQVSYAGGDGNDLTLTVL